MVDFRLMERLRVERLLGWLSFAVGASALQPNESILFRIIYLSTVPYVWVGAFIGVGLLLVGSTYTDNSRCRIAFLLMLAGPWGAGLVLVGASGPLGSYGATSIVVLIYIAHLLWAKVHGKTPP